MNEEPRGSWYLLTGLILGLVIGLVLSLWAYPVRYSDSDPSALSESYRSEYRRLIADAYSVDGNLPRAQARLGLLKDSNPVGALSAQAQRMLADGGGPDDARSLALLAAVLSGSAPEVQPPAQDTPTAGATDPAQSQTPTPEKTNATPAPEKPSATPTGTLATLRPSATLSANDAVRTPTPETPSPTPSVTPTPFPTLIPPTATPPKVLDAPFTLARKSEVCDSSLPAGLIVVEVRSQAGAPLPGVRVQVAWDGGQDTFFTGLSPEISPGYGDFRMTGGVSYTLRVGDAGAPVPGLILPACGGSWKLEFQQGAH